MVASVLEFSLPDLDPHIVEMLLIQLCLTAHWTSLVGSFTAISNSACPQLSSPSAYLKQISFSPRKTSAQAEMQKSSFLSLPLHI